MLGFFFFQFRNVVALVSQIFCYKSERKVENFKNTAIFFLTYWNLLYNYGDCKKTKIPQNLATLPKKILKTTRKSFYELNWIFLVAK